MGQGQLWAGLRVGALSYLHLIKIRLQLRLLLQEEPLLLESTLATPRERTVSLGCGSSEQKCSGSQSLAAVIKSTCPHGGRGICFSGERTKCTRLFKPNLTSGPSILTDPSVFN